VVGFLRLTQGFISKTQKKIFMKLNIKELLDFFDDKKDSFKGDANALMAMFGEDLNAAVYKHFRKNKVVILDDRISQGLKKEKRLDRWILDEGNKKVFQCEIKNWAATAIDGRKLKSDAGDEEIKEVVENYWKDGLKVQFSSKANHPNGVTKVLVKMKPLEELKKLKVEPLLIHWRPISSDKKRLNPLSVLVVKDLKLPIKTEFQKLYIFSVSLYLRQLYKRGKGRKFIDLDMPHLEHRIKILKRLQTNK
jgi:hypothetical protein